MITYEEKGYYSVVADPEKNRLYLSFFGHIKTPEDIPHYNEHIEQALQHVTPGYTLLANIAPAPAAPGLRVSKNLQHSQKQFLEGGVGQTAVVLKEKGQLLHKMTFNVAIRFTGMEAKTFTTLEDAEKWLDEQANN